MNQNWEKLADFWNAVVCDKVLGNLPRREKEEFQQRYSTLLSKEARGDDISSDFASLVEDMRLLRTERREIQRNKMQHLASTYSPGTRIKFFYGNRWLTGVVRKVFCNIGDPFGAISVERDDGVVTKIKPAESQPEIIDESHPPLCCPEVAERRRLCAEFAKGDWVSFTTAWRTVQAKVAGQTKDGYLKLNYDGSSRHEHHPSEVTKIPQSNS